MLSRVKAGITLFLLGVCMDKGKRHKLRRSECPMEEVQRQLLLQEKSEAVFAPSVTSVSGVGLLCLI